MFLLSFPFYMIENHWFWYTNYLLNSKLKWIRSIIWDSKKQINFFLKIEETICMCEAVVGKIRLNIPNKLMLYTKVPH